MNFTFFRSFARELRKSLLDYIVLYFLGLVTLFLLIKASPHRSLQLLVMSGFGVVYVLWAGLHHARENTFHAKIMLEYILIVLSILIMLYFLY